MNKFLALSFVFILSGCFLNRYEKPPTLHKIPFQGFISLVDVSSLSAEGKFIDEARVSASFTDLSAPEKLALSYRGVSLIQPQRHRGLQCQIVSNSTYSISEEELTPISVGEFSLGTLVSGQVISIPEVEIGRYEKALAPHFAPGIYFARSSGSKAIPGFAVEFAMPEEIRGVEVNEHSLSEGPAIFQKSETNLLELAPPTAPNDLNIVEIVLITRQDKEERTLVCGVFEDELELVEGKQQLEIPAAQMSGLYAAPDGVLEIIRLNTISGVVQNGPALRVEGLRAWVWPSWVAE